MTHRGRVARCERRQDLIADDKVLRFVPSGLDNTSTVQTGDKRP
jgi:hypothetical protein